MRPLAYPKRTGRLLGVLCLLAFVVALAPQGLLLPGPVGSGLAEAGDLEDAWREMERLQRQMELKQAEFDRLVSRERSLVADINRIQQQLDVLHGQLQALETRLAQTEQAIAVTEAEIADAEVRLEKRTNLMLTRIRAMSEVGYVHYLEALLGARTFSDLLSRLELLRQIVVSDIALFNEVSEEKRQLESKKLYLEEQRAELIRLRNDTSARRAEVARHKRAQDELLARLRNDKAEVRRALDELEMVSKELERYIAELGTSEGTKPTFKWPLQGWISSEFGMRYHPILKEWRLHTGIDIAAPRGREVRASAAGKVILATWAGGYGKCIVISHSANWSTLYAHLDNYNVRLGEIVNQGQVIGQVGSTGYSTGPHLHFEIRFKGEPVNPLDHLEKR